MNINENIRFPVTDTLHVWGSQEAIAALQTSLKARFQAGVARAELTEAPSADPGPEARGETPLPLELAG